jgi:hypothetical protein
MTCPLEHQRFTLNFSLIASKVEHFLTVRDVSLFNFAVWCDSNGPP